MNLVAIYLYIDSPGVDAQQMSFGGDDCADQAVAWCKTNLVHPADVCRLNGTTREVYGAQVIEKAWNPDLVWFRQELRKSYLADQPKPAEDTGEYPTVS